MENCYTNMKLNKHNALYNISHFFGSYAKAEVKYRIKFYTI